MLNFDQISPLEKITKKTPFFGMFCSKYAKNRQKFYKLILNAFLDLKRPLKCCIFSFSRFFFKHYMQNKVKKIELFALFGTELKKSAKNLQTWENVTSN